jgi:hypothetical protein
LLLLSMSKSDKTSGLVISANLPMSPWGSDHIINSKAIYELVGVWSLRILSTLDGLRKFID